MTLKEAIQELAKSNEEVYCKICTVDSVDDAARTVDCTPLDDSAPLMGVNLQANQEFDKGIVIFPTVGSSVIVGFLNKDTAAILLCEQVDRVEIAIEDMTVVIDGQGIVINGGGLGGLVKVEPLTTRLNTLEKDLNALKTAFKSWVVAPNDGGAALKGSAGAWAGQSIVETKKSDIENEKVKQ